MIEPLAATSGARPGIEVAPTQRGMPTVQRSSSARPSTIDSQPWPPTVAPPASSPVGSRLTLQRQPVDTAAVLAQAHREAEALVAQAGARWDGANTVVLRKPEESTSSGTPTASLADVPPVTVSAETSGARPPAVELTDDEVDAQARRLYPRIRSLFAAELRRDRERAGFTIDVRR